MCHICFKYWFLLGSLRGSFISCSFSVHFSIWFLCYWVFIFMPVLLLICMFPLFHLRPVLVLLLDSVFTCFYDCSHLCYFHQCFVSLLFVTPQISHQCIHSSGSLGWIVQKVNSCLLFKKLLFLDISGNCYVVKERCKGVCVTYRYLISGPSIDLSTIYCL